MRSKDRILKYVKDYIMLHGYPPTLLEISHALKLNKSTVSFHINNLLNEGLLESDDRCSSRALRVPGFKIYC